MLMLTVSRSLLLDLVLCTRVGSASRARSPPMELSRPRESSSRDPPRNEGSKMAIAGTPAALRTDAVPPPLTSTVLTSTKTQRYEPLDDVSCFGTRTIAPAPIPAVAAHFSPLR